MTSLSVMFKTFVWALGYEPMLKFEKDKYYDVQKMDIIGLTCMEAEPVMSNSSSKMKIKILHPDSTIDFDMVSQTAITVYDFVSIVNQYAMKAFDFTTQVIMVENIMTSDSTIVILTKSDLNESLNF